MTRILLVEPSPQRRHHLRDVLANGATEITEAIDLPSVAALDRAGIEVAIANADLGGSRGIALKTLLDPSIPVILYAEHGSVRCAVEAMQQGAADYLVLPMEPAQLQAALRRCMRAAHAAEDTVRTLPIIGRCDAIAELRERIDRLAQDTLQVLIQGEPGVGKELVARAIHQRSPRARMPLISISCISSSPASVEAELFGGAVGPGSTSLIEAAHGGTLLLDDISELSAAGQARLHEVLQRGEFTPTGASRSRSVDVMLLATSYTDLEPLVAAGRFHGALFDRFEAATLRVPPLRERDDDVAELARWLLEHICRRLSKPDHTLSDAALKAIRSYAWPGNVRELHNALERAVILCEDTVIEPTLLAVGPAAAAPSTSANDDGGDPSLEGYFVKFVLEHQDELTETELAAKLGISRKSLWERRQRLNIPRRRTRRRGTRHDVE